MWRERVLTDSRVFRRLRFGPSVDVPIPIAVDVVRSVVYFYKWFFFRIPQVFSFTFFCFFDKSLYSNAFNFCSCHRECVVMFIFRVLYCCRRMHRVSHRPKINAAFKKSFSTFRRPALLLPYIYIYICIFSVGGEL